MVNKIHIIGGAGSGKTTLAKKLGEAWAYPYYDLDTIAWKDHHKVPLEARLQAIDHICTQPAWITEGIFLWWTEALLEQADDTQSSLHNPQSAIHQSSITNRSPALLPSTSGK